MTSGFSDQEHYEYSAIADHGVPVVTGFWMSPTSISFILSTDDP